MLKTIFKSLIWLLFLVFIIIKTGYVSNFINIFVGIIAIYLISISILPFKFNTIFTGVSRDELIIDILVLLTISVTFFFFESYIVGCLLSFGIILVLNKAFR